MSARAGDEMPRIAAVQTIVLVNMVVLLTRWGRCPRPPSLRSPTPAATPTVSTENVRQAASNTTLRRGRSLYDSDFFLMKASQENPRPAGRHDRGTPKTRARRHPEAPRWGPVLGEGTPMLRI